MEHLKKYIDCYFVIKKKPVAKLFTTVIKQIECNYRTINIYAFIFNTLFFKCMTNNEQNKFLVDYKTRILIMFI